MPDSSYTSAQRSCALPDPGRTRLQLLFCLRSPYVCLLRLFQVDSCHESHVYQRMIILIQTRPIGCASSRTVHSTARSAAAHTAKACGMYSPSCSYHDETINQDQLRWPERHNDQDQEHANMTPRADGGPKSMPLRYRAS